MSELPDAFTAKTRKAAKPHTCCECGAAIEKGDKYRYSSGVWDGDAYSFKQCLNCHEIMEAAAMSVDYGDESPCFDGLSDWFYEFKCQGYDGVEWLNGMAHQVGVDPEKLNKLLRVTEDVK